MAFEMPPETKIASDEEVIRLRQAVMRLARELRKTATEEGLTTTQSSVLATVVRNEEMPISELAGAEGLNPTMLSRVIGHLEESELVARIQDATDRRSARIRATAKGRRVILRLRNRRTDQLMGRIEQLDTQSVETLINALPALEFIAGTAAREQ